MNASSVHRELFRHVSADKAAFYRVIMEVFAAASAAVDERRSGRSDRSAAMRAHDRAVDEEAIAAMLMRDLECVGR